MNGLRKIQQQIIRKFRRKYICRVGFGVSPQRSPRARPRCGSVPPEAAAGTAPVSRSSVSAPDLACTWAPWDIRDPLGDFRETWQTGPAPSAVRGDCGESERGKSETGRINKDETFCQHACINTDVWPHLHPWWQSGVTLSVPTHRYVTPAPHKMSF